MPRLDFSPSPSAIYALTCFATFILAALMSILVFWKNRRPAARWWAILCLFVAAWAFANTFSLLSTTAQESVKYLRIADAFALFAPVTFLHFAMHFSGKFHPRPLRAGYIATGLIALTVGSPLFVQAGQKKFGIWFEVGGPSFVAFAILFILLPGYGLWLLWQSARESQGMRRAQLLCLTIACAIGFGGGFMWFLPALNINIPPLGAHLIGLYCVIVAYAIVRYRFLDIQVVIRKSLVYSLLISLLTVCYFGAIYLLERLFQAQLQYHSLALSVTAFALMALAFQPLKSGIQRLVDWLIFRVPQEELVRRVERFEEEAKQTDKLRAVTTLAAGMAHEIKNPITAIQTFAEFVPEKHQDPAFAKTLQEVLSTETRRIQNIIQELLDFAKPKPPHLKPVEIKGLIESTLKLLSNDLVKHGVKWQVDCQHDGTTVHADADQLRQVLINLIQNASDAMAKGGELAILTKTNNGHIELIISDTGQGIPKELLPKIFDPFVTTKEKGNGLGLAVVHSIIKSHRGAIAAASTPGLGTTFTVRLPI